MRRHVDAFGSYLQNDRNAAVSTVRSYVCDLTQFIGWIEQENDARFSKRTKGQGWEKVTYLLIRRYLGYLSAQGYDRRSLVRKLSSLKVFYKWLAREDLIQHNPATQVVAPRVTNTLPDILNVTEIERLLALPDLETPFGLRDKALLELLYATGMRLAEAAALSLSDVNGKNGEARITCSKRQGNARNGEERVVPLGRYAQRAVRNYLEIARPQLITRCKRDPHALTDALWINGRGTRLSTHAIYMLVLDYARQAKIKKKVTPHTLRHTFAVHLLEGGADLNDIKELLGHRSLAATQIYVRLSKTRRKSITHQAICSETLSNGA